MSKRPTDIQRTSVWIVEERRFGEWLPVDLFAFNSRSEAVGCAKRNGTDSKYPLRVRRYDRVADRQLKKEPTR